jgi:alkaline phosphatase D
MSWDDHEVDNDYASDREESGQTPPEVFLLRRAAAYQAFYEAMPVRLDQWPRGADLRLYRSLLFGSLLDLSVLDTRQHRTDQACTGGRFTDCPAVRDASRTMLGPAQEQWLFDRLGRVKATWTVLGQQVPAFARDFGPDDSAGRFASDKWDGYQVSRDRLFARLLETRAPNPVVLSGDVHVHYGAELKRDFTRPDSETVGAEFTNTSITSGGDGAEVSSDWEALRRYNPHLKFHSARRGYIACTATPETMRADFKVLDRVTVPGEPARVAGSLVVEAGRRGVERA